MCVVSVIVPVYNTEKYISCCIESILRQTFQSLEMILVDDGATDDSGLICDRYAEKDQRIHVIHQKNSGLISARKTGLAHACGEWIAFCDSDDWMKADCLERLMEARDFAADVDICVGGYKLEQEGRIQTRFEVREPAFIYFYHSTDEVLTDLFQNRFFDWSLCGKIYRRRLWAEPHTIWNLPGDVGEDTEASWRLFTKARKIAYTPVQGYIYRMHSDSMMHKLFSLERLTYLDRLIEIMREAAAYAPVVQASVTALYFQWSVRYLIELLRLPKNTENLFCRYQAHVAKAMDKMTYRPTMQEEKAARLILETYPEAKQKIFLRDREMERICEEIFSQYATVFVYGAGVIADEMLAFLQMKNYRCTGIVVTEAAENILHRGYSVLSLRRFCERYAEGAGLILAMNERHTRQVMDVLREKKMVNFINLGCFSVYY